MKNHPPRREIPEWSPRVEFEVTEVELKVEVRSPLNREKGSVNVEKVLLLTTLSTVNMTPVPPNIQVFEVPHIFGLFYFYFR